jgi:hypothetical protein
MLYNKVKGHAESAADQIAVVSPSGRVMGLHDTEKGADAQIAALMANKSNSSRWVDQYSATKLLSGEAVRILPLMPGGYHRWGTKRDPVTFDVLSAFVGNFLQRLNIGGLTQNLPLNVEHDELTGKIGHFLTMEAKEDGLYAVFDLTPKGRQLLEDDTFDYLSPEIVWEFEDIITGEVKGPVVVGAAVTNYPFFGEATALYSDTAARQISERFSMDPGETPADEAAPVDLVLNATDMVRQFGFHLTDLELWRDTPVLAISYLSHALDKPERTQFHYTLALCDLQKEGEEGFYPRSAYLHNSGQAGEWEYRVKEFAEHVLEPDRRLVQQAHSAMQEADPGAIGRHASLFEAFVDDERQQEGTMPPGENAEDMVTQEQFTALQAEAAVRDEQIETLTVGLATRDQQLAEMRTQRTMDQFSREAEAFSAIGVEVTEYAEHFAWLQGVDPDGAHLPWFQAVFNSADETLAQSAAFQERGTGEQTPVSEPFARIQQLMEAEAKEQGVTLKPGTQEYNEIMTKVMNDNPEIFDRYRGSLVDIPDSPSPG